jgi:hypothetical protein
MNFDMSQPNPAVRRRSSQSLKSLPNGPKPAPKPPNRYVGLMNRVATRGLCKPIALRGCLGAEETEYMDALTTVHERCQRQLKNAKTEEAKASAQRGVRNLDDVLEKVVEVKTGSVDLECCLEEMSE